MNSGFELVQTNLGMSIEYIILIIVVFANLIFFAKDFKVGLVLSFFTMGLLSLWFYQMGWNFHPSLIAMFICMICMAFSLFASVRTAEGGAV